MSEGTTTIQTDQGGFQILKLEGVLEDSPLYREQMRVLEQVSGYISPNSKDVEDMGQRLKKIVKASREAQKAAAGIHSQSNHLY